jgi:hypothetical protein
LLHDFEHHRVVEILLGLIDDERRTGGIEERLEQGGSLLARGSVFCPSSEHLAQLAA